MRCSTLGRDLLRQKSGRGRLAAKSFCGEPNAPGADAGLVVGEADDGQSGLTTPPRPSNPIINDGELTAILQKLVTKSLPFQVRFRQAPSSASAAPSPLYRPAVYLYLNVPSVEEGTDLALASPRACP